MDKQYIVVLITAPSREAGRQLASALLEKKLAACVNILPAINSLYTWNGKLVDDEEVLLFVKTRADLFEDQLVPAIEAAHPYEVPEIIALPILMGSKRYLDWIAEETTKE